MDRLHSEIRQLRNAIRTHRDQKGDDRCWLDDYIVWNHLPDTKQEVKLPTYEDGMRQCRAFYNYRNAHSIEEIPAAAVLDPRKWDNDLAGMTESQLKKELNTIETAIRTHYSITGRERTINDDRELYSVLPEKIPADFRLPCPEDFLGTTKTDAGCPQFWRSHHHCPGEHNLHQWGPCRKP